MHMQAAQRLPLESIQPHTLQYGVHIRLEGYNEKENKTDELKEHNDMKAHMKLCNFAQSFPTLSPSHPYKVFISSWVSEIQTKQFELQKRICTHLACFHVLLWFFWGGFASLCLTVLFSPQWCFLFFFFPLLLLFQTSNLLLCPCLLNWDTMGERMKV